MAADWHELMILIGSVSWCFYCNKQLCGNNILWLMVPDSRSIHLSESLLRIKYTAGWLLR